MLRTGKGDKRGDAEKWLELLQETEMCVSALCFLVADKSGTYLHSAWVNHPSL